MKKNRKTYSICQKVSAIFMILTLFWLTISTPFVIDYYEQLAKQDKISHASSSLPGNNEEENGSLNNASEEKAPNTGNTLSEEFLHEHHTMDNLLVMDSFYNKHHNDDTYHAYHGELLVPPPNGVI